jgi:hypothetical protein
MTSLCHLRLKVDYPELLDPDENEPHCPSELGSLVSLVLIGPRFPPSWITSILQISPNIRGIEISQKDAPVVGEALLLDTELCPKPEHFRIFVGMDREIDATMAERSSAVIELRKHQKLAIMVGVVSEAMPPFIIAPLRLGRSMSKFADQIFPYLADTVENRVQSNIWGYEDR